MSLLPSILFRPLSSVLTSPSSRSRSFWRWSDVGYRAAYPNKKPHLKHRRHYVPVTTFGVQKQTRLRCVDNSKIGREAMAEGKPPRIIHVYSDKHYGVGGHGHTYGYHVIASQAS